MRKLKIKMALFAPYLLLFSVCSCVDIVSQYILALELLVSCSEEHLDVFSLCMCLLCVRVPCVEGVATPGVQTHPPL